MSPYDTARLHLTPHTVTRPALAADPDAQVATSDLLESLGSEHVCVAHQAAHSHYAVFGPARRGPDGSRIGGRTIGSGPIVHGDDMCACGSELARVAPSGDFDRYECAASDETVSSVSASSFNTCGAGRRL